MEEDGGSVGAGKHDIGVLTNNLFNRITFHLLLKRIPILRFPASFSTFG